MNTFLFHYGTYFLFHVTSYFFDTMGIAIYLFIYLCYMTVIQYDCPSTLFRGEGMKNHKQRETFIPVPINEELKVQFTQLQGSKH